MIKAIENLEPNVAAGLLARAALSLSYEDLVSADPAHAIIESVLREARSKLNLDSEDYSVESLERLGDFLDAESDRLVTPPDTASALSRLAERGDLPSDLYEISLIPGIDQLHGRFLALEKEIIETTIRAPAVEQHFGPASGPHTPAMISLFARPFRTKWPLKDFIMLVAGQRAGFRLDVHQAWRIYKSRVDLAGAATLVDWLRKFADKYGIDVEVDGRKDHFFEFASGTIPNEVSFPTKHRGIRTISRFSYADPQTKVEQSALVVSIDSTKYLATLDEFRVRREDILDEFVSAPRAVT